MWKNVFRIIGIFILGMGGGIFADQILWPHLIERPLFYKYRLAELPCEVTEVKKVVVSENTALQEAVEKVKNVLVGVRTKTKKGKVLEGSGMIVTSDGLIVTLADLIPQGSKFSFYVEGKWVPFQILKRDLKNNLALIKVEKTGLSTVGFADLSELKIGQRVFLLGIHFEKERKPKKIVNEGIIKYFDSNGIYTNIFERSILRGSPLFDIKGNVVGLSLIEAEGEVRAIPISKIKTFIGL